MSRNPFDPTFDQLPPSIPVFPLTGVLLLPRGRLPLNIFEPRYLAMVQDALAADRMIGMVQPTEQERPGHPPRLYGVGCAGRITSFAETEDGRFVLTLTGVARFRTGDEIPTMRGYRRVAPDWSAFRADLEDAGPAELDRDRLGRALKSYFRQQGIQVEWEAIEKTPDERLVTSLAMICPFEPPEKQALLETPDLAERSKMLLALIEMAVHECDGEGARH
ncbi:MAG TPA: LON peptidase substrate-binding domain-containing protein [Azospirillaceae bacterium]|nr:LON peptidase substrate-binding domain-containing protein [Azospirillaceae bacterium]